MTYLRSTEYSFAKLSHYAAPLRATTCLTSSPTRALGFTPFVSPNPPSLSGAAQRGGPAHHASYIVSQRKRKLVEQGFGWQKCVGLLRKLHHRGRETISWIFAFTSAAYNLVRVRSLLRPATA
jgi:hypothetical protein